MIDYQEETIIKMKVSRKGFSEDKTSRQLLRQLRWKWSAYDTRNQAVQLLVMALRESGDDETADLFVATWGKEFDGHN